MCDANDYAMGVVLGQRTNKIFKDIYYASKTFMKHRGITQLLRKKF